MNGARASRAIPLEPGEAQLPQDFGRRLEALKRRAGLTWEQMAEALGVDCRQVFRWRRGATPSGGAMLSLIRLAARVPGGLTELLDEERGGGVQKEESQ